LKKGNKERKKKKGLLEPTKKKTKRKINQIK
jgi:hypothetical protein